MLAALVVSGLGFGLARRRERPILAKLSNLPTKTAVDRQLVIGSMLFGIGWGLVGLCPGPALENLASLPPHVFVFVIAMIAGMSVFDLWQRQASSVIEFENPALANSDG